MSNTFENLNILSKDEVQEVQAQAAGLTAEDALRNVQPKRKAGRPKTVKPGDIKVNRQTRLPLGGFRNILTLENTNPNFHYFWAVDDSELGTEITRLRYAGYEFVRKEEKILVGEAQVYQTEDVGSLIRVPAGGGKYHYLMRIPLEWYEEDQARESAKIDESERAIKGTDGVEGGYGNVKISR
jgi:hypothetical protein